MKDSPMTQRISIKTHQLRFNNRRISEIHKKRSKLNVWTSTKMVLNVSCDMHDFLHGCTVHSLHLSARVTELCITQSLILDVTRREIWAINHPMHSYVPDFWNHFWKAKLSLEIRSDWLGKLGVEIIIIISSFPQLCLILMTLALLHIC